jgi:phosphate transport system protein
MAGYVEQSIENATDAWQQRKAAKILEVYAIEDRVNTAHMAVDDACFKLLALQHPLASDLRLIFAVIKINNDLERMVDLAVNIANNTEYYLKSPERMDMRELSDMSDEVRAMVRDVLNAFVTGDQNIAASVLERDDKVDAFKRKILEHVLDTMKRNPAVIEPGLNIILMAKNLERIGDHATNIAEDVIFTVSGQDVRHSHGAKMAVKSG